MGEKEKREIELFLISKGYEYNVVDDIIHFDISQLEEGAEASEFMDIITKHIPDE